MLSAASSPPPSHIGNYRTNPIHRSWATHRSICQCFIPDLFIREYGTRQCQRNISTYAQDLRHPFQILHRRLRVLLRSWARNGLRKCKFDGGIIQIYQSTPLHYWGRCTTRNILRLKESLSFSHKYLKWIDGQMMKIKGILHVMSLTQLDLPWFRHLRYPWRWQVILIDQPIELLVNPNENWATH